MKNFIFISPNFPTNYWNFCKELKDNGLNVLGIGDCPYDNLAQELKENLHEYYKVSSLENYDEVYRAVAFFIHKYGRIDFLESNNEYWLERDARLRTDFNITSGFNTSDIPRIKYKSKMKEYYKAVGIPVARYYLVESLEGCKKFIDEVGYPVIAKPDNGVGASDTWKIANEEELSTFYQSRMEGTLYIMEEFVKGEVNSYDAIIDSEGNPMFESGNVSPVSIMDIVNDNDNCIFYMVKNLADDVRKAGRATVKSFDVKSRFIHFEFFRLLEDQGDLGKKGDVIGLEVNMRPSGGVSPDMHNFANSTNVYKVWADMIAFDKSTVPEGKHAFCGYAGRRNGKDFVMSHEEVIEKYADKLKMNAPVADALSGAMGNYCFIGNFDTKEEMDEFYKNVLATK